MEKKPSEIFGSLTDLFGDATELLLDITAGAGIAAGLGFVFNGLAVPDGGLGAYAVTGGLLAIPLMPIFKDWVKNKLFSENNTPKPD